MHYTFIVASFQAINTEKTWIQLANKHDFSVYLLYAREQLTFSV